MLTIQQITADPYQKQTLALDDGTTITLIIRFIPMQFGWFIDELTRGDFTINGLRITNNPNMLNQFRNSLTFGLACFSANNREPSQQEDFSSGSSVLYLLTAAEVVQYTELLTGG